MIASFSKDTAFVVDSIVIIVMYFYSHNMTDDFKQYHVKARFVNYPYISNEEYAYSAM